MSSSSPPSRIGVVLDSFPSTNSCKRLVTVGNAKDIIGLSVFSPRGSHQRVKLMCVLLFPDGGARKTQRFIMVWAREGPTSSGGRCFYYLAPKCLYRGEYKSVSWMDGDEVWLIFYVCLVFSIPSCASPFIVPRGDLDYMA